MQKPKQKNIFSYKFKRFSPASYIWLLIPLALAPLSYAHAYIDPGSGSYAVQMVVGLLFGGGYALKTFGGRIIQYFKSRVSNKKNDK